MTVASYPLIRTIGSAALFMWACSLVACSDGQDAVEDSSDGGDIQHEDVRHSDVEPDAPEPELELIGPFTSAVHGMAFDSAGTLYFSDSFEALDSVSRLYRLSPPYDGEPEVVGVSGDRLSGLFWADSELFVCDVSAQTIGRYDAGLTLHQTWLAENPWNITQRPGGELVTVSDPGSVQSLGVAMLAQTEFEGLLAPFDIVATASGHLWISEQGEGTSDPGRVAQWTINGQMTYEVEYDWRNPEGIALDLQGNLWVVDTERGEVLRVSSDGTSQVIAEVEGLPICLERHPDGDLYFNVTGTSPSLYRIRLH